jgi:hypothetical protein
MGNLEVSLYWEEKALLIIKFLQLYGWLLMTFYENFPYQYQQTMHAFVFLTSADLFCAFGPNNWYLQL